MSLECPKCKAEIEADSSFCDQCGIELLKCTACGRLGLQKRCIFCGKPLAPVREGAATTSDPVPAPGAPPAGPDAGAVHSPPPPSTRRLRLSCPQHGFDLLPSDGDILGRRFGPHMGSLGRFSQVSSRHVQVKQRSDGSWTVVDLESFNSTFYNGSQLEPKREYPIASGGTLRLADIELRVTLE
jgi:hypothetical protein